MNVGDPESHLSDVRVRRALAHALDSQVHHRPPWRRRGEVANGPFSPDQIGHLEDTGYPEYDPEEAKALLDEYKEETGNSTVEIAYTTTTDPANLQTAELLKQFWEQVGFTIPLAQIEQGQFIITALTGDFEMFGWRNHGGVVPGLPAHLVAQRDRRRVRCALALNFGRIKDDVIDENLDIIRACHRRGRDHARRPRPSTSGSASRPTTCGPAGPPGASARTRRSTASDDFTLPDGQPTIYGNGIGGSHQVAQLWVEQ